MAGILQVWLRELPEPVIRENLFDQVLHSQQHQDEMQRLHSLQAALKEVDSAVLRFLCKLNSATDINDATACNKAVKLKRILMFAMTLTIHGLCLCAERCLQAADLAAIAGAPASLLHQSAEHTACCRVRC